MFVSLRVRIKWLTHKGKIEPPFILTKFCHCIGWYEQDFGDTKHRKYYVSSLTGEETFEGNFLVSHSSNLSVMVVLINFLVMVSRFL